MRVILGESGRFPQLAFCSQYRADLLQDAASILRPVLNSSSLTQQRHDFYWCSRAFYDCARDVAWQDIVPMGAATR